jgi:hypothetical protein
MSEGYQKSNDFLTSIAPVGQITIFCHRNTIKAAPRSCVHIDSQWLVIMQLSGYIHPVCMATEGAKENSGNV